MRLLRLSRYRVSYPRQNHSRRGLSLLEMLLAVGLSLVLLTGIYTALDVSNRQATVGKAEMQRLQLARAILRRMEMDLRATMFDVDSAVSDTGTDANLNANVTTIVSDTDSDTEWTGSLGIRGSSSELWIDLSHISRELEFTAATAQSDMQTVAYFLSSNSSSNDSTGPYSAYSISESDDSTSSSNSPGLARSQGERSVLRALNESSTGSVLPGPTQVLAPEVDALQFRYFDGLAWYEEWDSSTIGDLPRAVEVIIGIDSGGTMKTSVSSPRSFRMVVAIPASDPLLEEETY